MRHPEPVIDIEKLNTLYYDKIRDIVKHILETQYGTENKENTVLDPYAIYYITRSVMGKLLEDDMFWREVLGVDPYTPIILVTRSAHTNEHTTFHELGSRIYTYDKGSYRYDVYPSHVEVEKSDEGDLAQTYLVGGYQLTFGVDDEGRLYPFPLYKLLIDLAKTLADVVINIAEELGYKAKVVRDRAIDEVVMWLSREIVDEILDMARSDSAIFVVKLVPLKYVPRHLAESYLKSKIFTAECEYATNLHYIDPYLSCSIMFMGREKIYGDNETIPIALAKLGLLEDKDLRAMLGNYFLLMTNDEAREIVWNIFNRYRNAELNDRLRKAIAIIRRLVYEPKTMIEKLYTQKREVKEEKTIEEKTIHT